MRYAAVLVLVGLGSASTVQAAPKGTLAAVADTTADDIETYLKEKKETAVTLGDFVYTVQADDKSAGGKLKASAGPVIREACTAALAARGITPRPKGESNVTLSATYIEAEEGEPGRQIVLITVTITRRSPADKLEYAHKVTNPKSVAELLGLTVSFPPDADAGKRGMILKAAADAAEAGKRTFVPKNAEVRGSRDARFGVEIWVAPEKAAKTDTGGGRSADDYKPRLPENNEGLAFVPIKRGEVYGVVLVNDAEFDAAVTLRIDGLSMFSFSDKTFRNPKTNQPLYTYMIIPKKSRLLIRGWHVTNDHSDEFKVTSYAESAAAELKSTAPTGTITATFHAAWDPKGNPPADEPANPDEHSLSADATGKGARFQQKYVEVERKVGVAREVVSVRYTK